MTSTINVYAGSTLLIAATNSRGKGSTQQAWQKFTTSFVASGSKLTVSFLNGDPSGDQQNRLDAVTLVAE